MPPTFWVHVWAPPAVLFLSLKVDRAGNEESPLLIRCWSENVKNVDEVHLFKFIVWGVSGQYFKIKGLNHTTLNKAERARAKRRESGNCDLELNSRNKRFTQRDSMIDLSMRFLP